MIVLAGACSDGDATDSGGVGSGVAEADGEGEVSGAALLVAAGSGVVAGGGADGCSSSAKAMAAAKGPWRMTTFSPSTSQFVIMVPAGSVIVASPSGVFVARTTGRLATKFVVTGCAKVVGVAITAASSAVTAAREIGLTGLLCGITDASERDRGKSKILDFFLETRHPRQ